jgi:hypothetical protein
MMIFEGSFVSYSCKEDSFLHSSRQHAVMRCSKLCVWSVILLGLIGCMTSMEGTIGYLQREGKDLEKIFFDFKTVRRTSIFSPVSWSALVSPNQLPVGTMNSSHRTIKWTDRPIEEATSHCTSILGTTYT